LDASAPRHQFGVGEGVVEALHRHPVHDLGEGGGHMPTHLLRRRVGRDEVGVLLLQRPQLPDEGVVVGVGDDRLVEVVVAAVVLPDLGAQPVDPGHVVVGFGGNGHRAKP
jgi:hypothetical protein